MCQARIRIGRPGQMFSNDCACPASGISPPANYRSSPRQTWRARVDLYRTSLRDGWELFFDLSGRANVAILNEKAVRLWSEFDRPRRVDLYGTGSVHRKARVIRQLAELGFVQPYPTPQPSIEDSIQTLHVWLHVTNACNLDCTYCYLHKTDAQMDVATGRAAIDAAIRSAREHGFRGIQLKYAGGEATLNFALVRELHAYAQDATAIANLDLSAVLLSNGVALTVEMVRYMREEGIDLMISLDGIGQAHDRQRPFVNGRASFTQVAKGIDRAIAGGLPPSLSITVSPDSAPHLPEAMTFALNRDLYCNFNFQRDMDPGMSAETIRASHAVIIDGIHRALDVLERRLPRRRLIDGLIDRSAFNAPHERACSAGHSYLVIDQDGNIARCQMEIKQPVTDVFDQDPLRAVRSHGAGFQNRPVTEKSECSTCTWRHWCAGGCPLLTFKATGRNDVKSPYCEVYKAIFPRLLEIEGLRLLKWGEDEPLHPYHRSMRSTTEMGAPL